MQNCLKANETAATVTRAHDPPKEFMKPCLGFEESSRRQELAQEIIQIQRDERCVQRAARLMAILTALAVAGLLYPAILLPNFPSGAPPFVMNLVCAVGVGSLISLLAFVGLGVSYRQKLDQRRKEGRQRGARVLESRSGKPVPRPWREDFVSDRSGGGVQVAAGDHGSPAGIESAARG
jgi:hypothetical protein